MACERVFVSGEATILHADLDAFYASVEQRDDPTLRGPAGDRRRAGWCSPASYEAKACGIRTAMGGAQARRLCPRRDRGRAAHVGLHARPARRSSRSSRTRAPLVEGLSIDEAFLDVRGLERISGTPVEIARGCGATGARAGRPADHGRGGADQVPGQGGQRRGQARRAARRAARRRARVPPPAAGRAALGRRARDRREAPRRAGSRTVGAGGRACAEATLVDMLGRASGPAAARAGAQPRPAARAGAAPAALDGRPARARAPRADGGVPRRHPGRARGPARSPAAGRAAGLPDGRAAAALRRLLASHALAHAGRGHGAHPDDPRHREGAAGHGHADDRAPGDHADRGRPRAISRTTTRSSWRCHSSGHRARALDLTIDTVRDRFGTDSITRAVLVGRDPGISVPLLPD